MQSKTKWKLTETTYFTYEFCQFWRLFCSEILKIFEGTFFNCAYASKCLKIVIESEKAFKIQPFVYFE